MKAYLIDDEPAIPAILENLLALYCPHVQVVGKSFDWENALQELPKLKPDVVFLDIRMPKGTGFDFLDKVGPDRSFEVVFVTGFQDHALQALKADAADYILKPIDYQELQQAVERVEKRLQRRSEPTNQDQTLFIFIHVQDTVVQIPATEILYLEADNNYTRIETKNQGNFLASKTLKEFEIQLINQKEFTRINRSVIINARYVDSYSKNPPFKIEMQNQMRFDISRRKKQSLKNLANYLGK